MYHSAFLSYGFLKILLNYIFNYICDFPHASDNFAEAAQKPFRAVSHKQT